MGINRNISLDELTNDLADRTGNFSSWVRCRLLEEFSKDLEHVQPEGRDWIRTGKCNPANTRGCCYICWPEGVPNKKVRNEIFQNMMMAQAEKRTRNPKLPTGKLESIRDDEVGDDEE
ncbi:MAG TPA: hypothetical protein EYN18_02760 [Nitrospirales bacterium]|nr:hypothetical protein [Nitrospirales bacterium]